MRISSVIWYVMRRWIVWDAEITTQKFLNWSEFEVILFSNIKWLILRNAFSNTDNFKNNTFRKLKPFYFQFLSHLDENVVLMSNEQLMLLCQGAFLVVGVIYIEMILYYYWPLEWTVLYHRNWSAPLSWGPQQKPFNCSLKTK